MDQDETWHAARPRPWTHCVRWGHHSSSPKRGRSSHIFGSCSLWPNGLIDQHGTWHGGRPQPRLFCVRWGPSPSTKRGRIPLPNLRPISIVAKRLDASRCMPLGMEVGLSPWDFVLDGDQLALPKKGRSPLPNFRPISIEAKRLHCSRCRLVRR